MSFVTVTILRQRGPVEQEEPIEAPEGLQVDFETVLSTDRDDSRAPGYGCDTVTRHPARIGNTPCVFERRRWVPAEGYSAEGEEDAILPYVGSSDTAPRLRILFRGSLRGPRDPQTAQAWYAQRLATARASRDADAVASAKDAIRDFISQAEGLCGALTLADCLADLAPDWAEEKREAQAQRELEAWREWPAALRTAFAPELAH